MAYPRCDVGVPPRKPQPHSDTKVVERMGQSDSNAAKQQLKWYRLTSHWDFSHLAATSELLWSPSLSLDLGPQGESKGTRLFRRGDGTIFQSFQALEHSLLFSQP